MTDRINTALRGAAAGLALAAVFAWAAAAAGLGGYTFAAAGAAVAAAIAMHFAGKKQPGAYLWSFALNHAAAGLAIGGYYSIADKPFEPLTAAACAAGCLVLLKLFSLLLLKQRFKKTAVTAGLLATAALTVYFAVSFSKGFVYSFGFFLLILTFIFAVFFATALKRSTADTRRDLSFVSFGAALLIIFIVLVILSEGEALDGIGDLGIGGDTAVKKKKGRPNKKL